MRRRSPVEPRRIVFIGVEGKSERAFAQFAQRCCDEHRLHVHLNVKLTHAGDSAAVVEEAGRHLTRLPGRQYIRSRLVLLDWDRVERDLKAGRDARAVAARRNLQLIFQKPNSEGMLFRLYPGNEQRKVPARHALAELRKKWPEYDKPPTATHLCQRFTLSDIRRAARYDEELHRFLAVLGL